jgi:hypothetical protein
MIFTIFNRVGRLKCYIATEEKSQKAYFITGGTVKAIKLKKSFL